MDRAEDSDEDDENLGLSSSWEQVKKGKTPAGKEEWRKVATNLMGSKKGEERFSAMMEIIENEPNEYEAWVKITEEAAWVSSFFSSFVLLSLADDVAART